MKKNRERIFLSELKTLLEEEYLAGEKAKISSLPKPSRLQSSYNKDGEKREQRQMKTVFLN